MKNTSKERALTTEELKSLKMIVHNRVENWVERKLQLNTLITETINIFCKQVGMPTKAVKEAFLEYLKESFDETLEQARKKLEDLK